MSDSKIFDAIVYGIIKEPGDKPKTRRTAVTNSTFESGPVLGDLRAADGINRSVDVKLAAVTNPETAGPDWRG